MMNDTIKFQIQGYGLVHVTDLAYTFTVDRYLPANPRQLRQIVADRIGKEIPVMSVANMLAILADFDYNTDNSPFSIDNWNR